MPSEFNIRLCFQREKTACFFGEKASQTFFEENPAQAARSWLVASPCLSTQSNHFLSSQQRPTIKSFLTLIKFFILIFLSLTAAVSFYISFQRRPASSAFFPNSLFVRQVFFFGTITDQCGDSLYYIQPLFTIIIIYHLHFTFYHVYHLLLTTYTDQCGDSLYYIQPLFII